MATKQAPPAPAPLSAPQPPAAARQALAPSIVEMPKDAPNPLRELNERQAASLAKIAEARRTADSGDREGPPTPPKATPGSTGEKKPPTPSSTPPSAAEPEAKPKDSAKSSEKGPGDATKTGDAASTPKELRYDEKSLSRWAEKNPEEAKAWAEKHFKKPVDDDWVKLSHKRRRLREDVREQSAAGIKAAEEKLAQALSEKAVVDDAVGKLSPVADLWDAVGERVRNNMAPDFEAGDAAFLANTGITVDDYMRSRARRGIINPEMAKQKAENARLKRELEAAKGKVPAEPAKAAEPEEKPAPKVLHKHKIPDWAEDIEKKHGLRKFSGWEAELGAEMAKHHDEDLDEYSKDVEDVADKLLKKKLAELQGIEEPEEPKPKKAKRAPADAPRFDPKKVKAKADDDEEDDTDAELIKNVKGPTDPQARMRWAMERAAARSRNPGLE